MALTQEGRDYSEQFQMYKFYFSMRMTFAQDSESIIFMADLLNFHRDTLDRIFESVFRMCIDSVNLQHFNRNQVLDDDYVQFTIEHTNFVDYVFSSRNVKKADLSYHMLVGGLVNWLSNLAQSNQQMNIDNDWAILLQISRTSEVPQGFGKKKGFGLQSKVKLDVREDDEALSPIFDPDVIMDVQIPTQGPSRRNDDDEERELFGSMSEDGNTSSNDEDDEFDDDRGRLTNIFKPLSNENALTVFVNNELNDTMKAIDYYSMANLHNSGLSDECLLVALHVYHVYLVQRNNFNRIMKGKERWLSKFMMNRLINVRNKMNDKVWP